MTIDEAITRIKEKMACDYNISGCDTCNISSCEDRDIVIQLAEWLEELKQYRAIGTPEECRAAIEKHIPKKPVEMKPTDKLLNGYFACPMCGGWVGMDEYSNEYCGCCGQKLDWSDNNEKL